MFWEGKYPKVWELLRFLAGRSTLIINLYRYSTLITSTISDFNVIMYSSNPSIIGRTENKVNFSEVHQVWIWRFPSLWPIAVPTINRLVGPTIYPWLQGEWWIHAFLKNNIVKRNGNGLVQDLISDWHIHFLRWWPLHHTPPHPNENNPIWTLPVQYIKWTVPEYNLFNI